MNIADNVLKAHLKNVFFVCGTACGGKTTLSRELAQKHGFVLYDMDANYAQNKEIANSQNQPAMTQEFESWEEYFNRPYLEYSSWLRQSIDEQLEMVIIDLIKLSQQQQVVADLHLPLETAKKIADYHRVAFLIAEPKLVSRDYYTRPDHSDLYECIMSLKAPQKAFDNCSKTLEYTNQTLYDAVKQSEMFWIERDEHSTIQNTLLQLEEHFLL